MDSGPAWDETTTVMVLRTYLEMAMAARSESMFKASLELLMDEMELQNYLGRQGK